MPSSLSAKRLAACSVFLNCFASTSGWWGEERGSGGESDYRIRRRSRFLLLFDDRANRGGKEARGAYLVRRGAVKRHAAGSALA